MVDLSYPFRAPDPASPDEHSVATVGKWRSMARWWIHDGVHRGDRGELACVPAADALAIDLYSGSASVDGMYYENTDVQRIGVDPAHPTLARQDQIVLRLTVNSDATGEVLPAFVPGVPGDPNPRPLVQTDEVYEVHVQDWRTPRQAGVIPPFPLDPGRFAAAEPGAISGPSLPSFDARRQIGTRFLFTQGVASSGLVVPSAQSLDYVWDGTDWCIAAGQLLASTAFHDHDYFPYKGAPSGIGFGGGSSDNSLLTWTRPKSLPGKGFRYKARLGVNTDTVSTGDLITWNFQSQNPVPTYVGLPEHQVVYAIGPGYNSTKHWDAFFPGTDAYMGVPGPSQQLIAATVPTGRLQHYDGLFEVYSA